MTTIMRKTELRAVRRGRHLSGRAEARTSEVMGAASHVGVIKRFGTFTLTVALLSIAAAGIVALKSAIWISHFSH
jgi:hypothetical protein